MPTEPGNEAVDAMATRMWELDPGFNPEYDAAKDLIHELLAAALPIERNRWEQEVRERLTSEKMVNALASHRYAVGGTGVRYEELQEGNPTRRTFHDAAKRDLGQVAAALNSIFGEAEPVEGEEK